MEPHAELPDTPAVPTGHADYVELRRSIDLHAIVSMTDDHGRIIDVNDKFCQISGYSRDELMGRNHRIINSGVHERGYFKDLWDTIRAGRPWQGEICNRAKNGDLYWVLTTVVPIAGDADRPVRFLSIRTDITAQKHAEFAAEAASDAKSRFLANISHEIRTPMAAIIGLSDLAEESSTDPVVRHMLAKAKAQGRALVKILNQVLDYSKIERNATSLESKRFDARELVLDVVGLFAAGAEGDGIDLASQVGEPGTLGMVGDEHRLRQVLNNLVGNAVKFCGPGDSVVVAATRSATREGGAVRFSVSDTGPGIPESEHAAIFEAFRQVDSSATRSHGGTGLGLTISSQLVALMGGELRVESEPGLGSTFSFSLPTGDAARNPAERPSGDPDARRTPAWPGFAPANHRVLVVDDTAINREIATMLLSREGFAVTAAANGVEGVTAALGGNFDAVLMDIEMPDIDGFEATSRIRALKSRADLPIVAVTAHALAGYRERCLQVGMNNYLAKPYTREELVGAVAAALTDRPADDRDITADSGTGDRGAADRGTDPDPAERGDRAGGHGARAAGRAKGGVRDAAPSVPRDLVPDTIAEVRASFADLAESSRITLLELFLDELRTAEDLPEPEMEGFDDGPVAASVHRFKGAAFSVGAMTVADMCVQVEDALAVGEGVGAALADLRRAATALSAGLGDYLSELARASGSRPSQPLDKPRPAGLWAEDLAELRGMLEANEFVPPARVELLIDKLPPEALDWVGQLRRSITRIDYATARALIASPPAPLKAGRT